MTSTTPSLTIASPDISTLGLPIYANTATVTFTPYDFRLTFSLMRVPHDQDAAARPPADAFVLTPQAVVEVMVPPGEARVLSDLLAAEFKQYVGKFGEPHRGFE